MHGFIYEWTNSLNSLKYIGRHQGTSDDGYVGSGTIFKNSYNKHPELFSRIILWESSNTTTEEILSKEEEFLSGIPDEELYYGINRKYYNQVRNSAGYTSEENPMRNAEVVARMMATRALLGTYRTPWEATVNKYGYTEAIRHKSERSMGNTYAKGNRGLVKSADHKKKISNSIGAMYKAKRETGIVKISNGGRPRAIDYGEVVRLVKESGMKDAATILSISLVAMRSRYYNAIAALKCRNE